MRTLVNRSSHIDFPFEYAEFHAASPCASDITLRLSKVNKVRVSFVSAPAGLLNGR
jgi:hypothetical protein